MSWVELVNQPPAIVQWQGHRFGTRVFRVFDTGLSRESILNDPTQVVNTNTGATLPAIRSEWAGMKADTISVSVNTPTLDVVYSYSNTAQRVQRTTTTQTESTTVPWFSRRINYQPNPAVVGGVSGRFTSYEQRSITIPLNVTRLMVRVFFSTEQNSGWNMPRIMALNNGYAGKLFNLNGTAAISDSSELDTAPHDILALWKYEGCSMVEISDYIGQNGETQHWYEITYNFVHEAGVWSDNPTGPVECTGVDGLDPLPGNGLNGTLQTPWRTCGVGDDGRAIEIWPPAFRSVFEPNLAGAAREWKVPPFHQVRAVNFLPVLSAEVIGSPIFVCECPYELIPGRIDLPGL